jgi:hypothetical protein
VSVPAGFTQSNTCPASLAVGSSCTIQVTFHPTATGTSSGFLSVSSNSSPPVVSDFVSGTGVNPAISVSPASIAFGNTTVGTDAPVQTVTVTNPGTTTLHVNALSISGDPDFFTLTNTCIGGTGVVPGGTCTIQIEFQPRTAGPGTSTLTIGSDASNGAVSASLSGTGVNPVIATVSPSVLNFGNQAVGTQSPTQTISLTNTGTGVITVSGVTITGDPDFILVDNGCAGGFAAGITCSIRIAFAPKSAGPGSATLTITSNASNNPVSVPLSGTGFAPPQAAVSPASINFGSVFIGTGNSTPTVTVSNTGGATLHINSLAVAGDPDFFTLANNCVGGTGVVPGGSCTIQMEFQPHSAGPGSATLTVGSDASNGVISVSLSGTGVSPATASVSPAAVNFGSQAVSTQSASQIVTVSSTGTGPLHISSFAISGDADFSILNSNCPIGSGMTQGASCIIQVAFAPKSVGAGSAMLIINSDASNGPVSVGLSGSGIDYALSAPASLNVRSGDRVQTTITVSAVGGNFSNAVALSCSGLPSGASCSFSPASVVPGASSASSSLSINTQQSGGIKTPLGTYTITVNGTSGGLVHSAPITLTVTK